MNKELVVFRYSGLYYYTFMLIMLALIIYKSVKSSFELIDLTVLLFGFYILILRNLMFCHQINISLKTMIFIFPLKSAQKFDINEMKNIQVHKIMSRVDDFFIKFEYCHKEQRIDLNCNVNNYNSLKKKLVELNIDYEEI